MSYDHRIKLATEKWHEHVEFLATLPDKELVKRLEIISMQSAIAEKKKMTKAMELLEIWWRQVVDARIYKAEHNIPDTPSEIELAIADIETFTEKAEQRQETLKDFSNPTLPDKQVKQSPSKVQQQEDDSQLSLF